MRVGLFGSREKRVEEQPLRAELFSIEQFKVYAKSLAQKHPVSYRRGQNRLLLRLKENEKILSEIHELLNETGKSKRKISPAGEWILDNFYLIEEQIRLARKYLPESYIRELPHLTQGPLAGYPRVYEIAMELVSHGDGRLDARGIEGIRVMQGLLSMAAKQPVAVLERATEYALNSECFRLRTLRELCQSFSKKHAPAGFIQEDPLIRPLSEYQDLLHVSFKPQPSTTKELFNASATH
jgi:hypothetical protein